MISNISAITVQCQEARSTDEGAVPKQDAPRTVPVALRDDFKKKLHEMEQINLEKPCRASLLQREDEK